MKTKIWKKKITLKILLISDKISKFHLVKNNFLTVNYISVWKSDINQSSFFIERCIYLISDNT